MDTKERIEGVDDYVRLLSKIIGRLAILSEKRMSEDDKKAFVDLLLETRKMLIENYDSK
jgi:hypothetical protein